METAMKTKSMFDLLHAACMNIMAGQKKQKKNLLKSLQGGLSIIMIK